MADANRIAAALRYQQDQAMPSPLAAAIQSPEYIGDALRDPQFYGDIGRRLSGLLKGGLQDILPTGAGPIMAKQGYEADPNYMQKMNDVGLAGMTVFHGSPYKFDKFDMGKIGTGEGAQAFGHGLYFAENPGVAETYKKVGMIGNQLDSLSPSAKKFIGEQMQFGTPSEKIKQLAETAKQQALAWDKGDISKGLAASRTPYINAMDEAISHLSKTEVKPIPGNMYRVDLPDEHIAKMLDWDKPLSQHSKIVQDALQPALQTMEQNQRQLMGAFPKTSVDKEMIDWRNGLKGEDVVNEMVRLHGGDTQASAKLRELGIPGIRYLDAGSRTGGAGTSNFVVFDDKLPKIIGRE